MAFAHHLKSALEMVTLDSMQHRSSRYLRFEALIIGPFSDLYKKLDAMHPPDLAASSVRTLLVKRYPQGKLNVTAQICYRLSPVSLLLQRAPCLDCSSSLISTLTELTAVH
jgi:hypothetical protein